MAHGKNGKAGLVRGGLFIQTRVSKSAGDLVKRFAKKDHISLSAYLRKLVMADLERRAAEPKEVEEKR